MFSSPALGHGLGGGGGVGSGGGGSFSDSSGADGMSPVVRTFVVPQRRRCSGYILFHNTQASQASILGSVRSVLMKFTKYYAVVK
jgi:hypothetical protein